jgi:hypothetical protein
MFDIASFDKFRDRILEHGIYNIQKSGDNTEITFILGNGEVYQIYTKEIEVDYVSSYGYHDGTCFMQSEMVISQTVEP